MSEGKLLKGAGWIATKLPSVWISENHWLISPKEYFLKNGYVPDCKANLEIPFLDEVKDHTLVATDGSDGRELLLAAGFEILEDQSLWYFNQPGYIREIE